MIVFVVVAAMVIFAIVSVGVIFEGRDWNGGVCPCENRYRWQHFDVDSQGSTGYKCPNCGRTIWIGYPVDRK